MKIAFLSHLDANLYLFRLPIMRELVKRGHRVYAITPKGEYFEKFKEEGIEALAYSIERRSLNPLQALATIKSIYEAIKPLELDILQNFTVKPNLFGSVAGSYAKIPRVINTVTGLGSFYVEDSPKSLSIRWILNRLYRVANQKADLCIFQNRDDRDYFLKRGMVDPSKAILIRSSGVDTKRFSPEGVDPKRVAFWRKRLSPEGRPVVLMVARAIWHKGVREFYEAARQLQGRAEFALIGGTDRGNPSCADEAFLGSGAVRWLRECAAEEMAAITAACDLYVLPSYREGVPRTLLEAASMGKALVATDVVGCREVVEHEKNGLLVPPRDSVALAGAIGRLLGNGGVRERMGEASRKLAVEEFDVKRIVEQYLPLYGASDVL